MMKNENASYRRTKDPQKIEIAVRKILEEIGEDLTREGLIETPARVARMYREVFSGLQKDPREILKTSFDISEATAAKDVVAVTDIPFFSMCEHHLLPFFGHVSIAYIPTSGNVAGLSKFSRLVDCLARRPQVQERLGAQIADLLQEVLRPRCTWVQVAAEHMCMSMRGVRAVGSKTKTLAIRTDDSGDIWSSRNLSILPRLN